MNIFDELKAQWVWLPQTNETVNQYVDFRHEFTIDEPGKASLESSVLHISIDTEYAVWINGIFVDFNQYDDYPDHKSYDGLDVGKYLVGGRNALCILGYHQGENSYQYVKGRPGLIYALKTGNDAIISGRDTFCRQSLTYKSGNIEKISPQLLFTFEYNASKEDRWLAGNYVSGASWVNAEAVSGMKEKVILYPRPLVKLVTDEAVKGRITAQGVFLRNSGAATTGNACEISTTAELMQRDYLSPRLPAQIFSGFCGYNPQIPSDGLHLCGIPDENGGVYLLIDMSREEAGLFELEVDSEEGVTIDASYGEQLDDLRVRASVGGRNFAFRYICKAGRQRFTHYIKRIAGRYIQLHISGIKKEITLYYAGIKPVRYPVELKGNFSCSDRLMNRIYEVSVRTLQLCMHEHYEDTPWREQGLYAMDSRNQALCGYYCFGEYDFAESSFSLFAEGLGEDGYLEICAPAKDRITIPSFSMGWIIAVADMILYSGRLDTAEKLFPAVKKMLDVYLGNMENGLMKAPAGERYWNFYEWADGLDGGWVFAAAYKNKDAKRLDALLNLFLCLALEAGGKLAEWLGKYEVKNEYLEQSKKLKWTFHKTFWDDMNKAYKTYAGEGGKVHFAELTQALALCCGLVPGEYAGSLRKRLADKDNGLVRTTLSYAIFKYEALLQEPESYGRLVFDSIAEDWGYMLYNKATSFWETINGADDFEKAGSMCHGWSAIPAYFFHAYLLGVKPLEPGFKKFSAKPVKHAVEKAYGRIPTPYGSIEVDWVRNGEEINYNLSCPKTIRQVINREE